MSKRNPSALGVWGNEGTRVVAAESAWKEVLKWNRKAGEAGERHRVFCASMADVFEDWQGEMVNADGLPLLKWHMAMDSDRWFDATNETYQYHPDNCLSVTMQDVRNRLFGLIGKTPNLDWLLLTKRPENVLPMAVAWQVGWPENAWLGTSVENREQKKRIDILRQVPARIRFLSIEPLLEDLGELDLTGIHWVIVGGESGHNARPMHPGWVRFIRDQCQEAGVPFFFKQWGEFRPWHEDDADEQGGVWVNMQGEWFKKDGPQMEPGFFLMRNVGKKAAGRILDGRTWDEVPGGIT